MTVAPEPRPSVYAAALESYWGQGWPSMMPIPPRQKASPPEGLTGWDGDDPSYADMFSWAEERPDANIALRMPPDVLGIDVDNYKDKHGGFTIERHEETWGPLPATWRSTSRDDGVSGIRFYKVPPGLGWVGGLPSVELIHRGHRYAVVCPSIHPEGRVYRWIDPDGIPSVSFPSAADLPPLPAAWVVGLSTGAHTAEPRAAMDSEQTWTWIEALPGHNHAMCPFMGEWVAKAVADISAHAESRHDVTRNQVLAVVRFGETGHLGTSAALDKLRATFIRLVTDDRSRTPREATSEWGRIVTGAVRMVVGSPEPPVLLGDPCPPEIATLRVQPRPTSPEPRLGGPGEGTDTAPPADPLAEVLRLLMGSPEPRPTPSEPEDELHSWIPKDLKRLLQNPPDPVQPAFLTRTDGRSLFYPGKVNGIIGASEGAKTWLMLFGVVQAVQLGINVGYLDFEDDWEGITERLRALGLTDEQIWTYVAYVNPEQSFDTIAAGHLGGMLNDHQPELVVLDGVNAAMTLNGWDLLSNKDATMFSQKILKPIAHCPWKPAVSYVDHLPKNPTDAGGAIGAQAKRAMTTGCAIKVEVARTFGKGQRGELILTVDKDRSGAVRGYCPEGTSDLGVAKLVSSEDGKIVSIRIEPAVKVPHGGTPASLRPTMEAISRFLEGKPEPVSGANIERFVRGMGTDAKRDAVERLLIEGYVRLEPAGRYMHHVSIRPYRTDPLGSDLPLRQTSPGSPGLASTSPGEAAEWSNLASLGDLQQVVVPRGEPPRGPISDLEAETSPDAVLDPDEDGGLHVDIDDEGNFIDDDTGQIVDPAVVDAAEKPKWTNMLDAAEAGGAPRIAEGWEAVLEIVGDGEWHSYDQLHQAIVDTGLAPATATNMLYVARHSPRRLENSGHHGRARRFRLPEAKP
jgi:Bifunctional DNA primase/polymerase, N-terminal